MLNRLRSESFFNLYDDLLANIMIYLKQLKLEMFDSRRKILDLCFIFKLRDINCR